MEFILRMVCAYTKLGWQRRIKSTEELMGICYFYANYLKNRTHTHSLPDKTPYEMVHGKKLNLHDAYEWGKDVYIKIKQDDKLANQATRAKWIGHSSQSDGHLIYWPNRHKISVEQNIIFDTGEQVKLSPTPLTDESKVPMTKKSHLFLRVTRLVSKMAKVELKK